jgi:hypothetical protein
MHKGKAGRLPTPNVGKGARCADPVPIAVPATGKPRCSESCTPGLARGGWKSAGNSNSLAAYSTACAVWSEGKTVRSYLSLQKGVLHEFGRLFCGPAHMTGYIWRTSNQSHAALLGSSFVLEPCYVRRGPIGEVVSAHCHGPREGVRAI